jgi:DNA-binding response OmpR family regulator
MIELPTILAITDGPTVRYWIKSELGEKFFLIDAATEKKALETVQTSHLDFIILDDALSDCSALDLCRKIKEIEKVPILLITGHLKKSYRDEALKAGVFDFLSDLLDSDELHRQIAAVKNAAGTRQKMKGISRFIPTQTNGANPLKLQSTALIAQIDDFESLPNSEGVIFAFGEYLRNHGYAVNSAGPGQFIIFLNEGDPRNIAEKLQRAIANHTFETKQGKLRLTASFAITKADARSLNKVIGAVKKTLKKGTIIDQEFLG